MIVSRVPYRISFFGGGTDYPEWYYKNGGSVLSTTIDKYCTVSCRYLPPFFLPARHRVVWSHIENVSTINEILHPAVRGGLKMLEFDDSVGLEIHHLGDLPARAGMGSSSSFANALILGLSALRGQRFSQSDVYRLALKLEQDVLSEAVGSQDQVATAIGGFNVIDFNTDGSIDVKPIVADSNRLSDLDDRLMLFYLGTSRLASDVAKKVIQNLSAKSAILMEMFDLVDQAAQIVRSAEKNLDDFGRLLDYSWSLKKKIAEEISNDRVDMFYNMAKKAGAIGGKLLGAGSTGFMVFYVPPERQTAVRQALESTLNVPFGFERLGAHVWFDGMSDCSFNGESKLSKPALLA